MLVYETGQWIGRTDSCFACGCIIDRPLSREEHTHEFYEILFQFGGAVTQRINGETRRMDNGQLVFLRPGDSHVCISQEKDMVFYNLSVIPSEIEALTDAYHITGKIREMSFPPLFRMSVLESENIRKLLSELDGLTAPEERRTMMCVIVGTVLQYWIRLSNKKEQDWFGNLLAQMKKTENLAEGVPAMMRIANLSHAQLCRKMKAMNLAAPKEYVRELRLTEAYDLIRNTSMRLEDISYAVGYYSTSHFSTIFKERFGVAPGALRGSPEKYRP